MALGIRHTVLPLKLIGMALLLSHATSHAQLADDTSPPYVDEQGEEVFGLGYMPQSPDDAGTALLIGQPGGGAQVDAPSRILKQSEFSNVVSNGLLPGSPEPVARLPLLKSVRESKKLKSWTAPSLPIGNMTLMRSRSAPSEMTVHVVYVGQGSGAILEFPCGIAVIDTGGEYNSETNGGRLFLNYLESFFAARPQLNRTIDVLFTSHPHKDHLYGLSSMQLGGAGGFTIRNIVDNGQTGIEGSLKAQTSRRQAARNLGSAYSAVEFANQTFATGATNNVIDPITCSGIDPKITAFWGGRNGQLARGSASARRYSTPNNHSVVLRVDFGKASMLFLGDLQHEGADDMLSEYEDNLGAFDVDVFLAAHHGAENGTSDRLIRAMTPRIGIISMGDRSSTKPSTAFDHGHPRLATLAIMQNAPDIVSGTRNPVTFWGAASENTAFQSAPISKAIYGTGWEGSLLVKMKSNGTYRISTP